MRGRISGIIPAWLVEALGRAHRAWGGGGGSVADSGWSCKEEFGSTCEGLPADNEHEGNRYCLLHFPSSEKESDAFLEAIEKKVENEDFDFRGIYFPRLGYIPGLEFAGATSEEGAVFNKPSDFTQATFEGGANFTQATFEGGANFTKAIFEGRTDFEDATFEKEADFTEATFEGEVSFTKATFEEEVRFDATFEGPAYFNNATFKTRASFLGTTFKEGALFWSLQTCPQTFLAFRLTVAERPERVSFHTTPLRPSYFVDVDAHKFDFSDVQWFSVHNEGELKLEDEIQDLEDAWDDINRPSSLRILQKSCRQLMNNAEENRDYSTANQFHYWSMLLTRKEAMVVAREKGLRAGLRRFGLIDALYGALSGYGDRPWRASLVLLGMWAVFVCLYLVTGSIEHVPQALLYSLAAMVRLTGIPAMAQLTKHLQPSEPGLFQFLVTAEGILGPLQIALLALAIRRKVMR